MSQVSNSAPFNIISRLAWLDRYLAITAIFVGLTVAGDAQQMTFSISGGYFEDGVGQRIVEPASINDRVLFQLVNLGPNQLFDPIPEGAWVGGDDVLIDLPIDGSGTSGDAFSIGGFAAFPGFQGFFSRSFSLAVTSGMAEPGDAVGIRWFPGLTVGGYLADSKGPSAGEEYGQVHLDQKYSYPSDPNRYAWFLPATSITLAAFEPAVSPDYQADNTELTVTPGFDGSPGLVVLSSKPWRSGILLDSTDDSLGGEETLRRSLYQITLNGNVEYRLVKEWFDELPAGPDPYRYEVSLANSWIVADLSGVDLNALRTDLESDGYVVTQSPLSNWFVSVTLLNPETETASDLDSLPSAIQADLRTTFGSAISVYRNRIGFTQSSLTPLAPNDPHYSAQSALHSLGVEQAWALTTGSSSVVVGVIDTGIDTNHPDLLANLWSNPNETEFNGLDDDSNGLLDDIIGWDFVEGDNDPQDQDGHGTQMSGIIGAVGDNGQGVAGVNWQVKLLTLKCGVSQLSELNIISAIDYAIDLKNDGIPVAVLNHSYTILSPDAPSANTPLKMAVDRAEAAGILMVAAAGNSGIDSDLNGTGGRNYIYPADYPSVISVASVGSTGVLANNSNFGASSVDLAAPGVSILSTADGGGYASDSGTSQAAAFVSGSAALVRAYNSSITFRRLTRLVTDAVKPTPALLGKVESGGVLALDRILFGAVHDEWAAGIWGVDYLDVADAAWDADPDSDGVVNIGEFALGTNAILPDAALSAERMKLEPAGGGDFAFRYSLDPEACIVTVVPEVSIDLGNPVAWNDVEAVDISFLGLNAITGHDDYEVLFDDVPSVPERFLRLRFEYPDHLDF